MSTDLKNRFGPTALITGASDGIGRAFAIALAERGFDLVLVARRETILHKLALELADRHGIAVTVIAADLSTTQGVAEVLLRSENLKIGLLIAAAGFGSIGSFLDRNPATEVNMVDLNCRSVVALTHGIATHMAAAGRGGIILFGSLVGFQGVPVRPPMRRPRGSFKALPKD